MSTASIPLLGAFTQSLRDFNYHAVTNWSRFFNISPALSLFTYNAVARALHVSSFYFCKMFKKTTGLTFTNCLGRVRVEDAKHLLLNPHLRVSEVAYTVGFQSLTHFNRSFRALTGESPTNFRDDAQSRAKPMARNGRGRS